MKLSEVIPDRVTSSQSDPLRNWSVLLLGLSQLLLCSEGFVALLRVLVYSVLLVSLVVENGV